MAVPALENLVLFVALAGPDDVGTRAVEAALQVGADEGAAVGCGARSSAGLARGFGWPSRK